MATHVLRVRNARFGRAQRIAAAVGGVVLVVGVWVAAASSTVAGGVIALVGAGILFGVALTFLRAPTVVFDRTTRTITRGGGSDPGPIGAFNDFDGVEVVGRVDEKMQGAALHEVHKTYPGKGLIKYDVCLVSDDGHVPVIAARSKKHALAVQHEIVEFVGWTRQSTTIPDSRRLLS